MSKVFRAYFIHPDFDIPCKATFEPDGKAVFFDYADYTSTTANYPEEQVEDFQRWLLSSGANCDNLDRAYIELTLMGVEAVFIEEDQE